MIAALFSVVLLGPKTFNRTLSVYSDYYIGRKMSNGEKYDPKKPTVASNDWKLGTKLILTCPRTKKMIQVRVTDRMAKRFSGKRVDGSQLVWDTLTGKKPGLEKITVEVVK